MIGLTGIRNGLYSEGGGADHEDAIDGNIPVAASR